MKVRYLPQADRQALRKLRHMTDTEEMAVLFEEILRRPFSIQALWEYRKWFNMLTPDNIKTHPAVGIGCAQVLILEGKIDKAREVISMLPLGSYYQNLIKMYVPGLSKDDLFALVRETKNKGSAPVPNMTLTAGRPSVINGVWDFTPLVDKMADKKDDVMEMLDIIFGEQAAYIYDMMQAEAMYWRDDCYGALVKVVSVIPFLKERDDMRLLFAALTLEIYIMVINGQAEVVAPLMENMRKQLKAAGLNEFLPNIDAMSAWGAMYDGDYETVTLWMRDGAPDENTKFCMLDLFRYMVKMRAYIIQGKHLAVTALAMRLLPLIEGGQRYMDACELHIIWAMSDYADGRKDEALNHVEAALKLSEKYRYDRLFADEGQRVLDILRYYQKSGCNGAEGEYFERIVKLTEKAAAMHPRYLKAQLAESPTLTNTEMKVLRLLAELYTNGQIADITGTAEETVKKHCKHIFAKLQVKNRHQAVQRARELGIID